MKKTDLLSALQPVTSSFEKLSIPYYIGGSVASSVYGMARSTLDVDMVADVRSHHIPLLVQELGKLFYIDENMIQNAIENRSSFNLIHLETSVKIDVFVFKDIPYQQNAFDRRIRDTLEVDGLNTEFYFSSPEDIIISKLEWYKIGGKVSERQWLDVIGVLKIQRDSLDKEYLESWTKKLGLFELLRNAFNDAEIQFP